MPAKKSDSDVALEAEQSTTTSAPPAAREDQPPADGPEIRKQKFRDARGRVHEVRVTVLSPSS